jgi:hypothetical protein
MKSRRIISISFVSLIVACHIPNLNDINLSECIHTCSDQAKIDCKNIHSDSTCFQQITDCFNAASDCSDKCGGCETDSTCVSEDDCYHNCVHVGRGCTDQLAPCVDQKQDDLEAGVSDECIAPLTDCVADCIADVEDKLKG